MAEQPDHDDFVEEVWRSYLTTGEIPGFRDRRPYSYQTMRRVFRSLPHDPRCHLCHAPFAGIGGSISRLLMNIRPSTLNPLICDLCEQFAKEHQGGAEVELSMLFADVRGSTQLAENSSPIEFSRLINRFYKATADVLVHSNALIEKLIGDAVTGLFVPGIAGTDHARVAVDAAQKVLREVGHSDGQTPWAPVGVGVHTGRAYVGAVGSSAGVMTISALGDDVNTTARLASQAGPGEIIVSDVAARAANLDVSSLEARRLQLKGRSEAVDVHVIRPIP